MTMHMGAEEMATHAHGSNLYTSMAEDVSAESNGERRQQVARFMV